MRTERIWTGALPLALLLLGGAPGPVTAQAPWRAPLALAVLQGDGDRVVTGDHTVAAGETVEDMVVLNGDLRVEGTISGDAVVMGGDLLLEEGGTVQGDAVVTGGRIVQNGGRVFGEMRTVDGIAADAERQARASADGAEAAGAEASRMARQAARDAERAARAAHHERGHWGFLDGVREGFAGLVRTLALALVLGGIGVALVFYGRPYLETVSDTIRASTVRAGAVGLAAGFLVIPAFVVLVVALAVSIVGIPLLLVAAPLFPLAIAGAAILGLLAAAHAVGERTAEQRGDAFDLRYRNSYAYLFTGLAMLLAPLAMANLLEMTGFLGFLGGLLMVLVALAFWAAITVGFGAVILSRAGTRRTFIPRPMTDAFDDAPLYDEPLAPESDV